jgi:hypothetical protein
MSHLNLPATVPFIARIVSPNAKTAVVRKKPRIYSCNKFHRLFLVRVPRGGVSPMPDLRVCNIITCAFGRGDFGSGQGATREHTGSM